MTKFIDLTQPLTEQTPVYPGDPKTKISPSAVIERDGYNDHFVSFGTHVGTHIDAPLHMIAGGKTLDQFPIEHFVGNGVVIDASSASKEIGVEHMDNQTIGSGDIVLFYTGWADRYQDPKYFEDYPPLSEALAQYLIERKIKMTGVDMCSPDKTPFNVHKILLANKILIIENLTNLDQLLGKKFTVYALPLKLKLDAAQARVAARIE